MYYYVNPNLYGYMYYPNNYYGYIPFYPAYSNCNSCKNNYAFWGTHDQHNTRSENTISNESQEVDLQEQKFIPGQFSMSYPFILKNQPIIGEQPPMQALVGQWVQAPQEVPVDQVVSFHQDHQQQGLDQGDKWEPPAIKELKAPLEDRDPPVVL